MQFHEREQEREDYEFRIKELRELINRRSNQSHEVEDSNSQKVTSFSFLILIFFSNQNSFKK